jgi:hypothetical protein
MFKRQLWCFVFQGMVTLRFYTGSIVKLKKTPDTAVLDMVISVKKQCPLDEDIFQSLDVSKFLL